MVGRSVGKVVIDFLRTKESFNYQENVDFQEGFQFGGQANGISNGDLDTFDDQDRAFTLLQDVFLDREDIKDEVGFMLQAQLQADQMEGRIRADKAYKATMIALR